MSKGIHDGWTRAAHDTPLYHDARDNASLPVPKDQGEGAGRSDRFEHEKKFQKSERLDAKDEAVHVNDSSDIHVKPSATQGDRVWTKGTSKPKEHI